MGACGQGAATVTLPATVVVHRCGTDGRCGGSGAGIAGRVVRRGVPARRGGGACGIAAEGVGGVSAAAAGAGRCRCGWGAGRGGAASAGRARQRRTDEFGAWPGWLGAGTASGGGAGIRLAGLPDGQSSRSAGLGSGTVGKVDAAGGSLRGGAGRGRRRFGATVAAMGGGGWRDRGIVGLMGCYPSDTVFRDCHDTFVFTIARLQKARQCLVRSG